MWDTKQPLHYGYSWDLRVECLLQWRHWVTSWNQAWSRPSYLATGRFPLWRKQRAWVLALCCMDTGRVKGFGSGGVDFLGSDTVMWGRKRGCCGSKYTPTPWASQPRTQAILPTLSCWHRVMTGGSQHLHSKLGVPGVPALCCAHSEH